MGFWGCREARDNIVSQATPDPPVAPSEPSETIPEPSPSEKTQSDGREPSPGVPGKPIGESGNINQVEPGIGTPEAAKREKDAGDHTAREEEPQRLQEETPDPHPAFRRKFRPQGPYRFERK